MRRFGRRGAQALARGLGGRALHAEIGAVAFGDVGRGGVERLVGRGVGLFEARLALAGDERAITAVTQARIDALLEVKKISSDASGDSSG